MKSILFFSSMIFSSSLSFFRVLILATIISLVDFTYYTTIVALGAFLGSFFSFGIVEETYKKYPIWIAKNKFGILKKSLLTIVKQLFSRFIFSIIIILSITFLVNDSYIIIVFFSLSIGFLHSIISVLASTQRAIGDLDAYAFSSIIRAILAIVFVVFIAWLTKNYLLTLLAEIIAMFGGAMIAYAYSNSSLKKINNNISVSESKKVHINKKDKNGLILFISYTIISVPFYLDRSFVTLNYDETSASQYALLALFLSISFLLINVISQKVSPQIFKIIELTKSYKSAYVYTFKWCLLFMLSWILIVTFIWVFFTLGILPEGLLKYKLSDDLFLALIFLGTLSVTNLLEFVIISIDKEKKFLKSAALYLITLIIFSFITNIFKLDLILFIWMMILARLIYLFLIMYYIKPFKFLKFKINDE